MRNDNSKASANELMPALVQTPARNDWLGERITAPRRFSISIARPDGSSEHFRVSGGTSMGHTCDAIDKAGLGGVVRVMALEPGDAA